MVSVSYNFSLAYYTVAPAADDNDSSQLPYYKYTKHQSAIYLPMTVSFSHHHHNHYHREPTSRTDVLGLHLRN